MINIYGASDDLIEVDGDVYEEWSPSGESVDTLMVVSTGHVFRFRFGSDGWETRLVVGDPSVLRWSKTGPGDVDDHVVVQQDVEWVVCDNRLERAKSRV